MKDRVFDLRHTYGTMALRIRKVVFGLFAGVIGLLIVLVFLSEEILQRNPLPLLVAVSLIFWSGLVIELFRRYKLKKINSCEIEPENIAELLSYHMVLHLSAKNSVTPQTMLEAATESERGLFVLHCIGIERQDILAAMQKAPSEIPLETCLEWCLSAMSELETEQLDSTVTIFALLTRVPSLTTLLQTADLSTEDLKNILKAEVFHFTLSENQHHMLSPTMLVRLMGSIGRTWVIGYNTDLEQLTNNLSAHILSYERAVVLHRDIIENTVKILENQVQANILLLGPTGSGKRTLVQNIAYALRKHELLHSTPFTDVLILKTALLLSGTNRSDESLLHALNDANQGGRFILVIDDLAMLLKAADARLQEILINILEAKNIRTICIAENSDYSSLIKSDPILDHLLQKTFVTEPDNAETMKVLLEAYFKLEKTRHVRITFKALKTLITLCNRYIHRGAMPGTGIEILKEALLSARGKEMQTVTEDLIRAIISKRTRIDVGILTDDGKEKLLHLKERLQQDIIGQEHAIESISAALKRGCLNIGSGKRPIGTFLFLGTTGLGKTETAKALAKEYFGSEENMIRIDLNEYAQEASIPLLIGGQAEHGFTEGLLTKKVQEQPSSLILLDEIEKAHPKILNLFLQILDEGMLTSGDGEKADFRNTIIIATSNAGSRFMTEHAESQETGTQYDVRKALLETIIGERTFSPEFINRFDEVIVFTQPSSEEVQKLAILMLDEVIQRFENDRGIHISVEPSVIQLLVERGFSPEYGAREMRRTITQTIENYLADYLLCHTVKRGDEIRIQRKDLERT